MRRRALAAALLLAAAPAAAADPEAPPAAEVPAPPPGPAPEPAPAPEAAPAPEPAPPPAPEAPEPAPVPAPGAAPAPASPPERAALPPPIALEPLPAALPASDTCAASTLPDADGLARGAEWALRGEGVELEATLHIARDGRSPRALPFRIWDDAEGDRVLVRILPPAAVAGAAWLKVAPVLWSYDPKQDAVLRIPRAHWGDPWLDGELSLDDALRGSGTRDYAHSVLRLEERTGAGGTLRAWVVESTPRDPAAVPWARLLDWIDCTDGALVRREHYDAKGALVRTLELSEFRPVAGRRYPYLWVMTAAADPARESRVEVASVRFTRDFPADTFAAGQLKPAE